MFLFETKRKISHQKTSKKAQFFSGILKNRSSPQQCTKCELVAVQLEYLPCHENNMSHYLKAGKRFQAILVSKELEKEKVTSKKQKRFYQKLEKLKINTCLKGSLKGKYNQQKKTYQKLETASNNRNSHVFCTETWN